MAALAVKKLPEGDEWLYELKWDGYRALLIKDGDDVQIRSRNDKDLTAMYPGIVTAGRRQKIKQIVLDGEIVALGLSSLVNESLKCICRCFTHSEARPPAWRVRR
jgi:ATP-dependent DNA ligase